KGCSGPRTSAPRCAVARRVPGRTGFPRTTRCDRSHRARWRSGRAAAVPPGPGLCLHREWWTGRCGSGAGSRGSRRLCRRASVVVCRGLADAGAADLDPRHRHRQTSVLAGLLPRSHGRGLCVGRAAMETDGITISLEGFRAHALDVAEVVDALERAVRVAIGDDGLGLAEADA